MVSRLGDICGLQGERHVSVIGHGGERGSDVAGELPLAWLRQAHVEVDAGIAKIALFGGGAFDFLNADADVSAVFGFDAYLAGVPAVPRQLQV